MNYYLPTRLRCGEEILAREGHLLRGLGSRCLVVTGGRSARACGALGDALAALEAAGIAWKLYDKISPNPPIAACLEAGALAHSFGADFILGVGGGSPMDAAKAIALSAANPDRDEAGLYGGLALHRALPIVLVGTTAGTGSEVTPVAVITDSSGRKHSFRGEDLYAALSFGDPRYTASMPLALTAATGVDALAHCLESYFSPKANAFSRSVAAAGAAALVPALETVAAGQLPDMDQREALYEGSILGGMAISVTGTAFPHKLGYFLTERFGSPHGFACAAFEPELIRQGTEKDPAGMVRLRACLDRSPEELIRLVEALAPAPKLALTTEELEALLPRWTGPDVLGSVTGGLEAEAIRGMWRRLLL